jgi:hypothetical protein
MAAGRQQTKRDCRKRNCVSLDTVPTVSLCLLVKGQATYKPEVDSAWGMPKRDRTEASIIN